MDEEWKKLPLFVIFLLFVGSCSGFKGGDYSDHWRGQSSDKTFSPHPIQSSVSEVPVTGILPEEVGSRISTNGPLKRLNLLQSVKGQVSSSHELTSHVQSAPSSSVLASLPLPLNERPAGSLTLVQGSSGSSATDTASVSTPGESHYSPDSHNVLSSSPVSSQSTSDRSTPSLYSSSFQGNSGSLLETSSSIQEETAGLGSLNLSLQSPTSTQLLPSPFEVSNQSNVESTPSLFVGSASNSDPQSTGPTSPLGTQGSLSQSIYSTKTRGSASTSQGSSGHLIPTQLESGSYSGVSPSLSASNRYTPGSLLYRKFGAFPVVVSSQSTNPQSSPSVSKSGQSGSGTLTSSHFVPVQGSGSTNSLSLKPQGILGPYAPASPNKYVRVPTLSHPAVYSQSTSSSGALFGASTGFSSQEMSSTYTGSVQPQGIANQFAPGSQSSYPSVSLSSQGVASHSATVQSSRKQFTSTFTGSSGTQEGSRLQGSTTYTGSVQPQGNASPFAPGSPSSYPSVSLSSHQGPASPSATVQSSRKQFTSTFMGSSGTQEGSSIPSLQGSTTYTGSVQPQGIANQFAPGSPSSYPSVSLSSQGAASPSATVQSSKKFTSSYGTQEGSSTPFNLQGSASSSGLIQPQGIKRQFPLASPSSCNCPCVSLSSPQDVASQRRQALQSYSVSQSQKSPRWQPSPGIQTSGATASQGSSLSESSPIQNVFSSLSSAGGSLGDSGLFVSAQGGSTSYGDISLNSQSPSSKYTPWSHLHAKFGSSPLAVSTQSASDQRSNGLYSSDSLRTQGLGVVKKPSRLYQSPSDSPSSNQISRRPVTSQHPAGSNLAPSLGLNAQAPSVGVFSGILQTAQALRESGSDVQLYNQPFPNPPRAKGV